MPSPDDLAIARSAALRPLEEVARLMDLGAEDLEPYGRTKAKVRLDVLTRPRSRPGTEFAMRPALAPPPPMKPLSPSSA